MITNIHDVIAIILTITFGALLVFDRWYMHQIVKRAKPDHYQAFLREKANHKKVTTIMYIAYVVIVLMWFAWATFGG